jgi:hypothetical protein
LLPSVLPTLTLSAWAHSSRTVLLFFKVTVYVTLREYQNVSYFHSEVCKNLLCSSLKLLKVEIRLLLTLTEDCECSARSALSHRTLYKETNSVALSPQANYMDWATASRRNVVPTSADRRVSRGQRGGSSTAVNLSFLDRSRYFSFK